MKTKHTFYLLCIFSVLFTFSCKQESKTEKDTFSSPKTLFVEYVSAYTSGFISKNSEITVKLTKPVAIAEPGKEIDMVLFSFNPSLTG